MFSVISDMKRFLAFVCVAALLAEVASALELKITPGSLYNNMEALRSTSDNTLILTGEANVTDLSLLKGMSRSIQNVNMENLSIPAGEIPPFMLTGTAVQMFTFPQNTKIIGRSAFASTSLMALNLPASLEKIEDYAFSDCSRLRTVFFNSEPELGKGLFSNCKVFSGFELPLWIKNVPDEMFDGCSVYAVAPRDGITGFGNSCYRGTSVESLNLADAQYVGDYAFANMPKLSSVTMPSSRHCTFGTGAFFMDASLTEVPAWDGALSSLMYSHTPVRNSHVVNGPVVSEGALANVYATDSIALAANVVKIDAHAFRNMKSLKVVDVQQLGAVIPETNPQAFSGLENENGNYDINLWVATGTRESWVAHDLWRRFNVMAVSTNVVDNVVDNPALSISRVGNDVVISSTAPITDLSIYSASGIELLHVNPDAETYTAKDMIQQEVIVVKVTSGNVTKVTKLK